jgi:hypothetical protein
MAGLVAAPEDLVRAEVVPAEVAPAKVAPATTHERKLVGNKGA